MLRSTFRDAPRRARGRRLAEQRRSLRGQQSAVGKGGLACVATVSGASTHMPAKVETLPEDDFFLCECWRDGE